MAVVNPVQVALAATFDVIDSCGGRGVVIGGLALAFVSNPRATKDIDALVLAPFDEVDRVLEAAQALDFELIAGQNLESARLNRFLCMRHRPSKVSVDFQIGLLEFDYEVVSRGFPHSYLGVDIRVATAEDLIVMKAVAGRPQDLLDIDEIVESNTGLDTERIRAKLTAFKEFVEYPDSFETLIDYLGGTGTQT